MEADCWLHPRGGTKRGEASQLRLYVGGVSGAESCLHTLGAGLGRAQYELRLFRGGTRGPSCTPTPKNWDPGGLYVSSAP